MKTRLALLYGGRSGEHEVSVHSAESILAHLDRGAYRVTEVLIGRDGRWRVDGRPVSLAEALRALRAQEVVFPALHGPYGEDGTVQAMLEWLGVPYVGNGVFASAAGMDKAMTKKLLAADGLRVAEGVTLGPSDDLTADARHRLGLPVFVKPARAGSSLGVSKVERWQRFPAALRLARGVDRKVLVERAVVGREVDVAVLQHPDGRIEAGPPLEIKVAGGAFFDYDAKYGGSAVFQIPAALDPATTRLLQDRAVLAFHALGCRGLLRVDFFLPERGGSGGPVVNEVNTFPGMTAESQYPRIWQRAGIAFPALLDILISGALATAGQEGSGHARGPRLCPCPTRVTVAPARSRPRPAAATASATVQTIWSTAMADRPAGSRARLTVTLDGPTVTLAGARSGGTSVAYPWPRSSSSGPANRSSSVWVGVRGAGAGRTTGVRLRFATR